MTSHGVFSFQQPNLDESLEQSSTIPIIATLWTQTASQQGSGTLYSRVTDDAATLELVSDILMKENMEFSNFQPSLAVVITRLRNTLVSCLS